MSKKNLILVLFLSVGLIYVFYSYRDRTSITEEQKASNNEVYVAISRPADMKDLFLEGIVDGFLMAHPVAADVVLSDNNARYFIHSSEIWPNHPGSTLSALTTEENVLSALVWAHVKATRFINDPNNTEKVVEYGMNFTGKSEDIIRESLKYTKHTEFPSKSATKELLEVMIDQEIIINLPEKVGYDNEDDFFDDFFKEDYYKTVVENLEKDSNWKPAIVEEKVRVGYIESVLTYMTAYVALQEGYYEQVFKDIELISFVNAPAAMDAYSAGFIDAGYNGIGSSLTKNLNEGMPIFIIGGGNAEGQSLVVKNNINSIDDLREKTIASSGIGTTPDFLLRMFLSEKGLEYKTKK